jgi:hypothetical protein
VERVPGLCGVGLSWDPLSGMCSVVCFCACQVWRATHWLNEDGLAFDVAQIVWISNPIDHLWMRLQHLDAEGSSLLDTVHPSTSPFSAAQREYADMVQEQFGEGRLAALAYHFPDREDELITACRNLILELSTQLWFWFEVRYGEWPYKLLKLVAGNFAGDGGDLSGGDVAEQLFDACDCCLDDHMSIKALTDVSIPKHTELQGVSLSS